MTATQTSSREKPKRKCVARQKVKQVRSPASGSTSAITVDPASERITKHDKALTLLSRRDGATIHDMMDATGWQQHSVRGFLAGTVKKLGLELTSSKSEGELRRYRVQTKRGR